MSTCNLLMSSISSVQYDDTHTHIHTHYLSLSHTHTHTSYQSMFLLKITIITNYNIHISALAVNNVRTLVKFASPAANIITLALGIY